jgi:predicted N-acetyltransferase YhbS
VNKRTIVIRDALPSDAEDIAGLTNELGYPADERAIADRLAKILNRPDQLMLVAAADEKIAGWLQAHSSEVLESGFRVEIVGLVVGESFRRYGIGRRLVQNAEQWAVNISAAAIVVRSNVTRAESHLFYPALGFSSTKTQAVYRKPLKIKPDERSP